MISDDSRYLSIFYHVVEHLEASPEMALALEEEKSRDILFQAVSDIFSHLLRLDPDFDLLRCWIPCQRRFALLWMNVSRFTWKTSCKGSLQRAVTWAPMVTPPHDP
ncbi:hypothetical protein D1007_12383 [Hordeum vulgare]|nr:hypothetical protein D1007_12383 [Hordeum vulgare]